MHLIILQKKKNGFRTSWDASFFLPNDNRKRNLKVLMVMWHHVVGPHIYVTRKKVDETS